MLPVYSPESHSLYQDFLISNFLLYYPDPFSISRQTWKIIVQFWHLDLSQTTNILLDSPLMMCQTSVPFTISSGISGTLNRNIFLSSSDIKRRKPQKGKNSQISRVLLRHGFWIFTKASSSRPFLQSLSLIFRLYKQQFLDVSVSHGLIQPSAISLAGDDSPIRTSARLRYKKVCCCSENGISHCNCKRLFSQPDCNIGWDFIHKIRTAFYPSFLLYPQSP